MATNAELTQQVEELKAEISNQKDKIAEISEANKTLSEANETLFAENENLKAQLDSKALPEKAKEEKPKVPKKTFEVKSEVEGQTVTRKFKFKVAQFILPGKGEILSKDAMKIPKILESLVSSESGLIEEVF